MPSAVSSLSASKCESPELASAKRGAAREAVAVRLELVDEAPERRPVAQAEAVDVKRNAGERAHPGLPSRPLDSLLHAGERRQQAASPLHVPDAVELGHGLGLFPPCRRRISRSRRWRPSSWTSCPPATGNTSRSGTASAGSSRTSAAGCGCGRETGGRCSATSRR